MAAYGLYTHIQSNKRRSVALLIGLFFLVYLMVYAGALMAEAISSSATDQLAHAKRRHPGALRGALRDGRHRDLDPHRLPLPSGS